jgi:hypothetical protein
VPEGRLIPPSGGDGYLAGIGAVVKVGDISFDKLLMSDSALEISRRLKVVKPRFNLAGTGDRV